MMQRLLLASLLLTVALPVSAANDEEWTSVAPGVEYRHFKSESMSVHVTRVDLASDAITVVSTPEIYQGTTVSDFAKKMKAVVAINGDYFDEKFKPRGLAIGPCGQWTGTVDTKLEGVVAVGTGRALIQTQSEVFDPVEEWVSSAVSGWPMLVRECTPLTATQLPGSDKFTRAPHPRTAVGASRDGTVVYLVVAEGRIEGVPGMTLAELGEFMAEELGACAAINLDGGGSSAMWVGDRVVNRPSDGKERRVSDHLAVVLRSDYVGCPTPVQTAASATTVTKVTTTTTTTKTTIDPTGVATTTTTPPVTTETTMTAPATATTPPRRR